LAEAHPKLRPKPRARSFRRWQRQTGLRNARRFFLRIPRPRTPDNFIDGLGADE